MVRDNITVLKTGAFATFVFCLVCFCGIGQIFCADVMKKQNVQYPVDIVSAIDAAKEYAKEKGYKLEEYEIDYARLKNDKWFISFQGKVPTFGNHFSVSLNKLDKTKITLHPGE